MSDAPPASTAPRGLDPAELAPDPIEQFLAWFAEARAAQPEEPEAMTLATATPAGRPSARVVLLRGVDARGFVFFTHYRSRKGRELESNPHAALVFHWSALDRQVRVEGRVERVSAAESDDYFDRRPLGSRLGAMVSPQSEVIADRAALEEPIRALARRVRDRAEPVARPEHWGGYRVIPDTVEFWRHGLHRLHDRFRYRRDAGGDWIIERLAP
jgi:pyridoxamine 5'-phosphate oxidase